MIAVVGATKPCSNHRHEPIPKGHLGFTDRGFNCPDCTGPGKPGNHRVYALEEVRHQCRKCKGPYSRFYKRSDCPDCAGRLWVPTTDGWTLLRAAWPLVEKAREWAEKDPREGEITRYRRDYTEAVLTGDRDGALKALTELLKFLGYTLGEE